MAVLSRKLTRLLFLLLIIFKVWLSAIILLTSSSSSGDSSSSSSSLVALLNTVPQSQTNAQSLNHTTTYFRFDNVGPRILYGKTHYFDSLPAIHRLPRLNGTGQLKDYLTNQRGRKERFYYEYNPSLVHLPRDQIPEFLDPTKKEKYYLGVYRLSSLQGCFKRLRLSKSFKNFGSRGPQELLGFAILNTSLEIQAEVIVLAGGRDYRLFMFQQQLYLTRDTLLWPIWLLPPKNFKSQGPNSMNDDDSKMDQIEEFSPVFSSKSSFTIFRRRKSSCCTSQLCAGKNFNYFQVNPNPKMIFVETLPMRPHIVESIQVDKPCQDEKIFQSPITEDNYTDDNGTHSLFVTNTLPEQSFKSFDQELFRRRGIHKLPYSEERGTACCVSITNPLSNSKSSSKLLVGVSHTKIPKYYDGILKASNITFTRKQYNSRLYAFESVPPYRIVAQSGTFCLPFPSQDEEKQIPNMWLIRNAPLEIGTKMSCPAITFVTGMTDAIDDPLKAIITYGMNDCGARVALFSKSELIRMLFPSL